MSFLDELREYLESIGRGERGQEPATLQIDETQVRRHLLSTLEALEQTGRSNDELMVLHSGWAGSDFDIRFARALAPRLQALAPQGDPTAVQRLVHVAISRQLGQRGIDAGSLVRTAELDRLAQSVRWALNPATPSMGPPAEGLRQPRSYARRIRAVRGQAKIELTPIGRVFLDLTGRDAVRWLLHVESLVATGQWSEGLLTRTASEALLRAANGSWCAHDSEDGPPCAVSILRGLDQLGLLWLTEDEPDSDGLPYSSYELRALGSELLAEIADARDTPFRLLARGLLTDETHRTLAGSQVPGLSVAFAQSAAESAARQARLVAHEMTNALGPAGVALTRLTERLRQSQPEAELSLYCTRIEKGLERAFQFIEEIKAAANLTQAPERFDLGDALRSLVEGMEASVGVELQLAPRLPLILGYRHRFVLAMRDLLRNALYVGEASTTPLQVQVSARLEGSQILIAVDDNGPGVPVEERQVIFAVGFSRRSGGSGQGLSLLKEVVETDLGGTVDCDTSSLGGARFTVRIPLFPGERR